MMTLPTIKIFAANPRGWMIINLRDFDPKIHREFKEGPPPDDRDAVVARAKALGVKFRSNISTEALLERVIEAEAN